MIKIEVEYNSIGKIDEDRAMGYIKGSCNIEGRGEDLVMEIYTILKTFQKEVPDQLIEAVERVMDKDSAGLIDPKDLI